jgi:hypothetical protein
VALFGRPGCITGEVADVVRKDDNGSRFASSSTERCVFRQLQALRDDTRLLQYRVGGAVQLWPASALPEDRVRAARGS